MAAGVVLAFALVACSGSVLQRGTDAGAGSDGANGAAGSAAGGAGQGGSAGADAGSAGQGSGGKDGGAVDAATACAQYADAYCVLKLMCEPFFANWQWSSDAQRCRDVTRRWCRLSLQTDGSNTTAAWFADRAAKLDAMSCSERLYTAAGYFANAHPPGARADGAPCIIGAQCAAGYCVTPVGDACGTCYSFSKPGGACQSTSNCTPGCRCVAGSCALPAEIAHACDAGNPCMQGLTCTGGTCQITPSGGPCPTGWECGGTINGEFCSGGTCQPTSLGQPGALCTSAAPYCPGGGYCSGTTCPALPVLAGKACTGTADCEDLTYCDNGNCTELPNGCP